MERGPGKAGKILPSNKSTGYESFHSIVIYEAYICFMGLSVFGSLAGKDSTCSVGDLVPFLILEDSGEGIGYPLQHSWASLVSQLVKNLPAMWELWVWKIPWRRERLPTPAFWPGEFHGLYSPWTHKESDTTEQRPVFSPVFVSFNIKDFKKGRGRRDHIFPLELSLSHVHL